jgi:hypothetical protein
MGHLSYMLSGKGLTMKPSIGMAFKVYGRIGTIVAIHPFGTIDVQMSDGATYRVTGLAFL